MWGSTELLAVSSVRVGVRSTTVSQTLCGGPVSNVVLDFTAGIKGNDIPECSPPGELGGDVKV